MIDIVVNGQPMPWGSDKDVKTLIIGTLNYPSDGGRFVVALNGALLPIEKWPSTILNDGDIVDVLGAITGG